MLRVIAAGFDLPAARAYSIIMMSMMSMMSLSNRYLSYGGGISRKLAHIAAGGLMAMAVTALSLHAVEAQAQVRPDPQAPRKSMPAPQDPVIPPVNTPGAKPTPQARAPEKPTDFSKPKLLADLMDKLAAAPDEETAKAIAEAIQKLWVHSTSPTVNLLMSNAGKAITAKDYRKALRMLDAVVEVAPDYAEGWNRRATVLFLNKAYDASLSDIGKVLELEPRHFGALGGLALIMRSLGDKASALKAFRRALAIHPYLPGGRDAVRKLEPDVEGRGI